MKKTLILFTAFMIFLSGCTNNDKTQSNPQPQEKTAYTNIASSGVWLSFSEINTMLESTDGIKAEFDNVLQNCTSLNIKNIYIHVRSYCDSVFPSEYFPLIKGAEKYDFDIFEYMVAACQKSGIKVHAWINPYRVLTSSTDINMLNTESPAYKWLSDTDTDNDINVICMNGIYLNPAENNVQKLVIDGIREILNKYDIDGIHFDDYFYPTTDPEFDKTSYEKYKRSSENPISLDDWRRANVNSLISGCYTAIKFSNRNVVFSISPMASVEKNYSDLYADIRTWIKSGFIDCIIPQLYFGFEYPDKEFQFNNLLKTWVELTKSSKDVELIIGLGVYKVGTDTQPDDEEWQQDTDIIAKQAEICKKNNAVAGYVLFSYSSLFSYAELNTKQRENLENKITNEKGLS